MPLKLYRLKAVVFTLGLENKIYSIGFAANFGRFVKRFLPKKWGILIKKESKSLDFTGLKIPRDYLRAKGGSRLCNFYRENRRLQTPVFQYDFSRADADILRMAGKGAAKPDREWAYAVHPIIVLHISLEYRGELLWTENVLVVMQLYVTQSEGNRNVG